MNETIIGVGIACIVAAIVGGGVELLGVKIPPILDIRVRIVLGTFGCLLIALIWPPSSAPEVSCGKLFPNREYVAQSDDNRKKNEDDLGKAYDITLNALPPLGNGWPNNGGADAGAEVRTSCTLPTGDVDDAAAAISFEISYHYSNGVGHGAVAFVAAKPSWRGDLFLPGSKWLFRWNVAVTSASSYRVDAGNADPQACTLKIDDKARQFGTLALQPGSYTVAVSCPPNHIGDAPGSKTATANTDIQIKAVRHFARWWAFWEKED